MIESITPIVTAILSGIAYSVYWYVNKVADPTDLTKLRDLDPYPILATAIVGGAVGVYSVLSGGELTQVSIEVQLASYVAITAVIERGLKTAVRIAKPKFIAWGWL